MDRENIPAFHKFHKEKKMELKREWKGIRVVMTNDLEKSSVIVSKVTINNSLNLLHVKTRVVNQKFKLYSVIVLYQS